MRNLPATVELRRTVGRFGKNALRPVGDDREMPLSTKPLYLQVRDALADQISRGAWKPGSQLPSEGELARETGVSSGTMRKALELLEEQRLVVRRQGRGTFVNNHSPEQLADRYFNLYGPDGRRLRGQQVETVEVGQHAANGLECGRLKLCAADQVYRLRHIRKHDDEGFLLEDVVLPVKLFPGLLDGKVIAHEIGILAREYGILLGKAEERISIGAPPADVATILGVPPDRTTIRLDRVVMMFDGRPAEWRIAHCSMERTYYVAQIR